MANLDFTSSISKVPVSSFLDAVRQKQDAENQIKNQEIAKSTRLLASVDAISKNISGMTETLVSAKRDQQKKDLLQIMTAGDPKKQALANAYPEIVAKEAAQQMFSERVPSQKQHVNIMNNGEPMVAAFDPATNQYFAPGSTTPLQGKIEPYSAMNTGITLSDADRKDKALNAAADSYIKGNALPSQIYSSRTANGQKAIALAIEKDPNFNTTDYQVKASMKQDYTTKGTSGKNLTSLNTVINHLGLLEETGKALNNEDLKIWNKAKNEAARQTGNSKVDKMLAARDAVTSELGRVFQGVGMVTQEERNEFRKRLSETSSPSQIQDVADTWIKLMAGRLAPLKEAWNTKLSGETPAVPFVTKDAAKVLKKRGFNPETLDNSTSGSLTPTMKWNPKTNKVEPM